MHRTLSKANKDHTARHTLEHRRTCTWASEEKDTQTQRDDRINRRTHIPTNTRAHTYTHMNAHEHTRTRAHVHAHTHIHTYANALASMQTRVYACTPTSMHW